MIPVVAKQKISIIHNCIQQIKLTTNMDPSMLDSQLIQDAFVLNVQRSVQATIDLASWVCKIKNWASRIRIEKVSNYFLKTN